MRYLTLILCAVLVAFSLHQAQAAIIHVPGDSSTIQAGINGAVDDDTVLVAAGTYYEHINFHGKAILVTSEKGPDSTTISKAFDELSLVTFDSGEDTTSILDGFTITGAQYVYVGGGIHCTNSSPKIRNNIIVGNSATFKGSGLCCELGEPVLEANLFANNSGTGGGGAMHLWRCEATVRNNVIRENSSGEHSGGISLQECNGTTVEKNLILSNSTPNFGGGVTISGSENTILVNNTIINNAAGAGGGGVCIWYSDSTLLLNNIVVGSSAGYGVYAYASSNSVIEYNDVWNNFPANYYDITAGEGCISADPMFCDHGNDNFYLHSSSPCHGTGQGGADMGAFGVGCGGVLVIAGDDQSGSANSQVTIFFYIQNVQDSTDTFDLDVSDQLGWNIEPTYYELVLHSGQVDTVDFTVSIPLTPIGTVDSVSLEAVSKTDSTVFHAAYLTVTCDSFVEGWDVVSGEDVSGSAHSSVTVLFYVQNTGLAVDSCDLNVSDSLGWDIQPPSYQLTLDPGQQDSVFFDVFIPSTPLGTTDKVTLTGVSLTNPFAIDSASLLITCDSYNVTITDISDVGNDQGKQVRIEWSSFPGSDPLVTDFTIFRRIDSLLFALPKVDPRIFASKDYPPGNWDMIGTYQAFGETLYSAVVPTLKDSTIAEGMYWSVFFVRAGTDNPILYFDSPVDSGYSVDNLSPFPPTGLFASLEPTAIKLTWSPTTAPDFDYYTLYRDTLGGFTPDLSNRLGFTIDTTFVDSTAQLELGKVYYYLVTATDFSGNESDPSNEAQGGYYIAGDANADGEINMVDVVYLLNYLFANGPAPTPLPAGDANCDGVVDIADVIYLINYLF